MIVRQWLTNVKREQYLLHVKDNLVDSEKEQVYAPLQGRTRKVVVFCYTLWYFVPLQSLLGNIFNWIYPKYSFLLMYTRTIIFTITQCLDVNDSESSEINNKVIRQQRNIIFYRVHVLFTYSRNCLPLLFIILTDLGELRRISLTDLGSLRRISQSIDSLNFQYFFT